MSTPGESTLGVVIEKRNLEEWLSDNWVMFDKWGQRLEGPIPTDSGPASLQVEDVTDALKRIDDGRVAESVDRNQVWKVRAIVLNKVVVDRLPEQPMTVEDLLDSVRATGVAWDISPISVP